MKKLISVLLAGLLLTALAAPAMAAEPVIEEPEADGESYLPINADYFPDETFREYVAYICDADGDGRLSEAERNAVTEMDVSELGIESLMGIAWFPNLEYLDCCDNNLTTLDVSGNVALETLYCEYNRLTSLNLFGCGSLFELDCHWNNLKSLDLSSCEWLVFLDCASNPLNGLDLSHCPRIWMVNCYDTNIERLDLSHNPELEALDCSMALVTEVDISACPRLMETYNAGMKAPVIDDGTTWYYIAGDPNNAYTFTGDDDNTYYLDAYLVVDENTAVKTAGTPAAKVGVQISRDGKTAEITGDYSGLYARIALVLDNNGVTGLYVTQGTINAGGLIVIPSFQVPGLRVIGVNVALVSSVSDIQSRTPKAAATAFVTFGEG